MKRLIFLSLVVLHLAIAKVTAATDERKGLLLLGQVSSVITSTYDADEKFGEITQKYLERKQIVKFDKAGQKVHSSSYFANGESDGKTVYDFDSSGAKIKARFYNRSGGLVEYDYSNGKLIEDRSYTRSGELSSKTLYKYNLASDLIEQSHFSSDGKITLSSKLRYDLSGRLIERIDQSYDLIFSSTSLYKYNNKGFVTEIQDFVKGTVISTTRYEYDKYDLSGNWIIRRCYSGAELKYVEEREIEYYY